MPVTEELEVRVLLRPTEQVLQLVDDGEGAVDVEDDAAAGEEDDDDVEDVPEALEVRHAVLLDLTHDMEQYIIIIMIYCHIQHAKIT